MFKVSIPKISDVELMARYDHIKPVIKRNGKLHYFREFTLDEIKNRGYLWNVDEDVREQVGKGKLIALNGKDFICLHRYGYHGLFVPSIGEVLAQIEELDVPHVRAFEIIKMPQTAADFHKDNLSAIAFAKGFHVSTVRLYGKKE